MAWYRWGGNKYEFRLNRELVKLFCFIFSYDTQYAPRVYNLTPLGLKEIQLPLGKINQNVLRVANFSERI